MEHKTKIITVSKQKETEANMAEVIIDEVILLTCSKCKNPYIQKNYNYCTNCGKAVGQLELITAKTIRIDKIYRSYKYAAINNSN